MDDILKSIKAYLYDRSSSPLFGAFVLSWLAWNYRFVMALFANDPLPQKFEVIGEIFSKVDLVGGFWVSGSFLHGFVVPALSTYAYLYLYPVVAKPVYEYSLKKQLELKELKQQAEDNRLLTIEESRELHKKLALLQVEFDEETESYQRELSNLRKLVAQSDAIEVEPAETTTKVQQSPQSLSGGEEMVLKAFAGRGDHEHIIDALIHRKTGGQIDAVRVYLDDLADKGFIKLAGINERGGKSYALQPAGRKYLVTHELLEEGVV